jgi:hypothetical protein
MRFLNVTTAALCLFACATPRKANKDKAKPTLASNAGGPNAKGKYVCTYDEDTGSHLRNKVCRYIDDTAGSLRAREDTQENWRRFNEGPRRSDTFVTPGTLP